MKMMRKEMRILKKEMVKILEEYIDGLGKIWFYTRGAKREYFI